MGGHCGPLTCEGNIVFEMRTNDPDPPRIGVYDYLQTCQDLYDIMGERVIWNQALSDILEVVNLPLLQHTMHLMSALELRQKAILVAHIDRLFDHQIIKPANVQLYRMANDVSQAAIAPGGDGIVLMQDDGTLNVHKMGNLAQSRPLVVQRPDSIAGRVHEPFPTLLLSSSGEHHVAVACDHYTNME
jgi:hypothetical protein